MLFSPAFFPARETASGGHIFSVLTEKIWKKRPLGTRNSAVAPEKSFCFCVPFNDDASLKERPSGGRRIGFLERTIGRTSRFICAR